MVYKLVNKLDYLNAPIRTRDYIELSGKQDDNTEL